MRKWKETLYLWDKNWREEVRKMKNYQVAITGLWLLAIAVYYFIRKIEEVIKTIFKFEKSDIGEVVWKSSFDKSAEFNRRRGEINGKEKTAHAAKRDKAVKSSWNVRDWPALAVKKIFAIRQKLKVKQRTKVQITTYIALKVFLWIPRKVNLATISTYQQLWWQQPNLLSIFFPVHKEMQNQRKVIKKKSCTSKQKEKALSRKFKQLK